jgi:hypothetical protein
MAGTKRKAGKPKQNKQKDSHNEDADSGQAKSDKV